ncbi:hypothetical protein [Actinomadura sediminis]|uniref:DUF3592 domain-containing protein n=1 Tax=Actinomadura sediminis TaxID=1038904 RepID=A0ABW3EJE5_9ACTN
MLCIVGALLLAMLLPGLPQVIRAARPDVGVHGTFVAQSRNCITHPGHTACTWRGRFRSDDGTIDRHDVYLYGDGPGLRTGTRAKARDIGRAGHVYLMAGSREWVLSALLAIGALALIRRGARPLWAAFLSPAGRRRRRAGTRPDERIRTPARAPDGTDSPWDARPGADA